MRSTLSRRVNHGKVRWCVDVADGTRRRTRVFFPTREAAARYRAQIMGERDLGGLAWATLPKAERQEAMSVFLEMKAAGVSPRTVWASVRENLTMSRATLQEAQVGFLAELRDSGRRPSYLRSASLFVQLFTRGRAAAFVDECRPEDIRQAIHERYANPWSRRTYLARLRTFFAWAKNQGYCSKDPTEHLPMPRIDWQAPEIVTPAQAQQMVNWAFQKRPRFAGWLVATLFAGVRPQEADQLSWDNVGDRTLTVNARVAKMRHRRVVNLHPTAIALLAAARTLGMPLGLCVPTRRACQQALRAVMGWPVWPKDILRHSAASYWLSLVKNAPEVALELGHSPAILFRHYREMVTPADTQAFWSVHAPTPQPEQSAPVIPPAAKPAPAVGPTELERDVPAGSPEASAGSIGGDSAKTTAVESVG